MRLSDQGFRRLAELEGYEPRPYQDSAGCWTIGHGHLLSRRELFRGTLRIGGDMVSIRDESGLTREQAKELLIQDVALAERAVGEWVTRPLTRWQADALIIFAFNIGEPAFAQSTLLRRVNTGDYDSVPEQLRRWVYAGGKRVKGLANRREAEVKMWGGVYT